MVEGGTISTKTSPSERACKNVSHMYRGECNKWYKEIPTMFMRNGVRDIISI